MGKRKVSIHYFFAHNKIRNFIFEECEKVNELLINGPDEIKKYFCLLWNELKNELNNGQDLEIIDNDKQIKPDDFGVSYSILKNNIKVFNFIMPKPVTEINQAECISLVLTPKIPRVFTLELGENCYIIGEWKIDFEENDYVRISHGKIPIFSMSEYLQKVNQILAL
ncbi:MAG: hypothetical protein IJB90_01305 [Clostridia bacterium]|nr:hypothetical protein [Clostridia bacterium]